MEVGLQQPWNKVFTAMAKGASPLQGQGVTNPFGVGHAPVKDWVELRFAGTDQPGGKNKISPDDVRYDYGASIMLQCLQDSHPVAANRTWPVKLMIDLLKDQAVRDYLESQHIKPIDIYNGLYREVYRVGQRDKQEKLTTEFLNSLEQDLSEFAAAQGYAEVNTPMLWEWLMKGEPSSSVTNWLRLAKLSPDMIKRLKDPQPIVTLDKPALSTSAQASGEVEDPSTLRPSREEVIALNTALAQIPQRVRGQAVAITKFLDGIKVAKLGYDRDVQNNPNRPKVRALLLGPSGVGKTYTVETLARIMNRPIIYVPLNQYTDEQDAKKFTGASPGYTGYGDGSSLADRILAANKATREQGTPPPILLLDEIEKADPSIFDVLMQVLDKGVLENGTGQTASFKGIEVVMTSNIAQREIKISQEIIQKVKQTYERLQASGVSGDELKSALLAEIAAAEDPDLALKMPFPEIRKFLKNRVVDQLRDTSEIDDVEMLDDLVKKALEKEFRPEFIGRINIPVNFKTLSKEETGEILDDEISSLFRLTANIDGFELQVSPELRNYILDKGFNDTLGAREVIKKLNSILETELVKKREELILNDGFAPSAKMVATLKNGKVHLEYIPDASIA